MKKGPRPGDELAQEFVLSNHRSDAGTISDYQLRVSHELEDARWDAFLSQTAGGHHVQTGGWAQVKSLLGYRPVRVMLVDPKGAILSGAQILVRSFPLIGRVGFISKGPLFAADHPALVERTIQEILHAAQQFHIRLFLVQPPNNGDRVEPILAGFGFKPVEILLAPDTTVVLDLTRDTDALFAEMKSKTRYNIRLGQRKGVTVRQGSEADLSTFYRLLEETGRRQRFSIYPAEYYEKMWRVFHPHGQIHLFLAEYEGEVVSALLAVAFQDTVIYKMGAWSGRHGKLRPNQVMHWSVIEWAKAAGYHWYDFEGVEAEEAARLFEGKKPAQPLQRTLTSFKTSFGGQLVYFPGAFLYITPSLLRLAFHRLSPIMDRLPVMRAIAGFIRTR